MNKAINFAPWRAKSEAEAKNADDVDAGAPTEAEPPRKRRGPIFSGTSSNLADEAPLTPKTEPSDAEGGGEQPEGGGEQPGDGGDSDDPEEQSWGKWTGTVPKTEPPSEEPANPLGKVVKLMDSLSGEAT